MPAMALEFAWRTVITRNDKDIRFQSFDSRDGSIQLFNHFYFGLKIPIFPGAIGVLVMQKEELLIIPRFLEGFNLICKGVSSI